MAFSLDKRERERERERVKPRPLGIKQHFSHKNTKHENQNLHKIQILLHKTQNLSKIQILSIAKTDKTPKMPTLTQRVASVALQKPLSAPNGLRGVAHAEAKGRGLLRLPPLSHSRGLFNGQILPHKIQNSHRKAYKAFHKALNFTQILKKFTQITHCKRFA